MRRPSLSRSALAFAIAATVAGAASCGNEAGAPPAPVASSTPVGSAVGSAAAAVSAGPTVEDARAFFSKVDADLRRLVVQGSRADWVNKNFNTEDTDALAATASEANMEYMSRIIPASMRYKDMKLPDDLARQLLLLRLSNTLPGPADPKERAELAEISVAMGSIYAKGK